MRTIKQIFLHCAATPEGKDFTVADIKKWHLERGFNDIGYHYVIYRDGTVHKGRDVSQIGAHATGWNSNSIGICYIGGLSTDGKTAKDTRTPAQKQALLNLVSELMNKYNLPIDAVYGHCEVANKACPSFNMKAFRYDLALLRNKSKK